MEDKFDIKDEKKKGNKFWREAAAVQAKPFKRGPKVAATDLPLVIRETAKYTPATAGAKSYTPKDNAKYAGKKKGKFGD